MYKKILILLLITTSLHAAYSQGDQMQQDCFNFESIKPYSSLLVEPAYLTSHDGAKLAYYAFEAPNPKAAIIFYHGGAFWTCGVYHHMAQELAHKSASIPGATHLSIILDAPQLFNEMIGEGK